MENKKQQLMKFFATVLRNRALGKQTDNLMSKNLAFYFSRKELIELVKKRFGGSIPKEHDLVELENKELLELVGDEMYIISYTTEKWSREPSEAIVPKTDKQESTVTKSNPQKPMANDKKDKTSVK